MFEAYSVGVRISLVNGVAGGLLAMGAQLRRAQGDVDGLQRRLDRIKSTMLVGLGLTAVGAGILAGLKPALEQAKEFQTQVANFSTFGMGDAMTAQAVKFAKAMNVVGTSYVDAMRTINEAQGAFRESGLPGVEALRGAQIAAPVLAKIHFANASLHPNEAGAMDASAMSMLRFIEMRGGLNDPRRFNAIANAGYKAIESSKGNVSWDLYRQFMATGGVAAQGMTDTALFGEMEPIIGELKSRAGVAYMTAFNRLTGITRVPNQVAHDLVKQGLWDGSKIVWNSQGGIKKMLGNPLKDMATFSQSQVQWYVKNVLPMYDRMHLSAADRDREDALLGGRTGGMEFSIIRRQLPAIRNSIAAQQRAMGIDQAAAVGAGTLVGKQIILRKRWNDLLETTGETILPVAVQGLSALVPLLKSFSDWAQHHPRVFGDLVKGVAGLSVALIGSGVVTSLVASAQAFKILAGALRITKFAKLLDLSKGIQAISGAAESTTLAITGSTGVVAGLAALAVVLTNVVAPALAFVGAGVALKNDLDYQGVLKNRKKASASDLMGAINYAHQNADDYAKQIREHRILPKVGQQFLNKWQGEEKSLRDELNARKGAKPGVTPSSFAPEAQTPTIIHIRNVTQLDGRTIAENVTRHQARDMNRAQTGAQGYDPRASLPMAAGYSAG